MVRVKKEIDTSICFEIRSQLHDKRLSSLFHGRGSEESGNNAVKNLVCQFQSDKLFMSTALAIVFRKLNGKKAVHHPWCGQRSLFRRNADILLDLDA
jgi:hypothetical protein